MWPPLRRWWGAASDSCLSPDARTQARGSDRNLARLLAVRREFTESLADISTAPALRLVGRIQAARSMRELWHLRPEVFEVVARCHAQAEAERRLALLNRHFPTRSPRSGFGPLL